MTAINPPEKFTRRNENDYSADVGVEIAHWEVYATKRERLLSRKRHQEDATGSLRDETRTITQLVRNASSSTMKFTRRNENDYSAMGFVHCCCWEVYATKRERLLSQQRVISWLGRSLRDETRTISRLAIYRPSGGALDREGFGYAYAVRNRTPKTPGPDEG